MKADEDSHPRGMFLVAATEFWERFSFYSLMGLLVLFLTASAADGGFGWSQQQAVTLYGFYAGLGFIAPALGGWIANRWLGERRAILIGGIMIAGGQFMLVAPLWAPALIEAISGVRVAQGLIALDLPLGGLLAPAMPAGDPAAMRWIGFAYLAVGWAFAFGLTLIIMGTGLLKPTVSSIVGKLYPGGAARREQGFAIFMTCVFSGSVSASIVAGALGERVGWSWGFLAGGVGMSLGLIFYIALARRLLGDIGIAPDRTVGGEKSTPLSRIERDRIITLFVMGAFTVVYASAFYQKGGMLNLFVRDEIARDVGGFLLPTTWFQTISTGTFILLAHPLTAWMGRIGRGRIDTTRKLAIALLLMALGYACFTAASIQAEKVGGGAHMGWVIAGYACFGIGDVFLWPAQIALASRLAPARHAATVVGCWYLTIGVGTWTTGFVAMQASIIGRTALMIEIGCYCLVAATLVLALRGWLAARMHEEGFATS